MSLKQGLVKNPIVDFNDQYEQLIKAGYQYVEGTIEPQPLSRPPFTLTELKNAIPPHCFQRSMLKSFRYLTLDVVIVSLLFYCGYNFLEQCSLYCQIAGFSVYWFLQGSFLFGIWTMGHECGHSAFSENDLVNDTVGIIFHSAILVPYHGFKYTHRMHHANTGSFENDIGFIPFTKKEVLHVAIPMFYTVNGWGPKKYQDKPKSYFNPNAAFFLPKERLSIVLSDVAFLLVVLTILYLISICGFALVMRIYIIPICIMNGYLVTIAYLQHVDTYIPHFREGEWSWLRGALSTVDRSFGMFLDTVFHHLSDAHVCHHIFSKIPFYHCVEATEAIKPILGKYYLTDPTPIWLVFWRVANHCKYVEDDGDIVFYKSKLSM